MKGVTAFLIVFLISIISVKADSKAVQGRSFRWDTDTEYSFTILNSHNESIVYIESIITFYDDKKIPIHTEYHKSGSTDKNYFSKMFGTLLWENVEDSEEFNAYTDEEKERIRLNYFIKVKKSLLEHQAIIEPGAAKLVALKTDLSSLRRRTRSAEIKILSFKTLRQVVPLPKIDMEKAPPHLRNMLE